MQKKSKSNKKFNYTEAIEHLNTLEEIWDSKGLPEFSIELRLEVHQEKGKAYSAQGKYDEAIAEYQKVLKFCRDSSQLNVKAETFTHIGQLMTKQGDFDRALGFVQRAIGANRRLRNDKGTCKALRNLGIIYLELGEFEEAEINYNQAMELAEKIGKINDNCCCSTLHRLPRRKRANRVGSQ